MSLHTAIELMNINEFDIKNVASEICDMLVKTIIKAEDIEDDFEGLILPLSNVLTHMAYNMEDGIKFDLVSGEEANELFKAEWINEWVKRGEDAEYASESILPHLDFHDWTLPRWVITRAANACAANSLADVRELRKMNEQN
jgi:hypothetical protein